jgi:hypothetical protein
VGFSIRGRRFEFTHREAAVFKALHRIADDLAHRRLVLGDIWDVDGKRAYLDRLETEGVLPSPSDSLASAKKNASSQSSSNTSSASTSTKRATAPPRRVNLIPRTDYGLASGTSCSFA